MDRKEFILKALAGIVTIPALMEGCNQTGSNEGTDTCALMPEEGAGPYALDLSANPSFFRRDITESRPGMPLAFTLKLFNTNNNCAPITNARVDFWHCDKDGVYSGYNLGSDGGNQEGKTFFRGIQLSDTRGKVLFDTIYPGWYHDRITHIHFQVFLNNGLVATSQIAFPEDITHVVYGTPLYSQKGQNTSVADNASDMEFGDSPSDLKYELCSVTANSTGGYNAELAVGIAV